MLKYEIFKERESDILYRIRALRDFSDVTAGDIGGYIKSANNLSHEGNAWVYGDAQVYGNARVYGNASVCGNASVYGDAQVYDNASVYGYARVYDDAQVCGNAFIHKNMWIKFGLVAHPLTTSTLLQHSIGVLPVKNKVRLYKRILETRQSEYNASFIYPKKGWVEEPNAVISDASCASGLHFSHLFYNNWINNDDNKYIFIAADIDLDDIITVQQGKVRCKRAFIVG